MVDDWIRFMRQAGAVKRFHTERLIEDDTIAKHSFHVALLCLELEPDASSTLIKAALLHDLAERETGDVPAHAKWYNPQLKQALDAAEFECKTTTFPAGLLSVELTEYERGVLKWADYLEAALTVLNERELGNKTLRHVFSRLVCASADLPSHERAEQLLVQIQAEFYSHDN